MVDQGARLAKLRQLAEAATPGPWQWEDDGDGRTLVTVNVSVVGGAILWARTDEGYQIDLQLGPEDQNFIAAADPQTILALLDDNAQLLGAIRQALAMLSSESSEARAAIGARDVLRAALGGGTEG
jgi:hypothetical protein